ncbi:MAG: aspartate/glutamate racemase family protein [Clostridia bacterium]|nr:aspartate/glutamate racemase family protein [Clostridia bacterium]
MNTNRLGIIGGMGPEATCDFYHRITQHTVAQKDQDHIDMVILNHASIIDRTYAVKNHLEDILLQSIAEDMKIMEQLNVTHIAIPCNTCHTIYNRIQGLTSIPVINMVEETIKYIVANQAHDAKIGIMATDGTIYSNMYQHWFEKYHLPLYVPSSQVQQEIMNIIYKDVKSKGLYDTKHFEEVLNVFLENGCSHVILGCTELSGFHNSFAKCTIDPMDFLVKASIEKTGGIYKGELK